MLLLALAVTAAPAAAARQEASFADVAPRELVAFLELRDTTLETWLDRHPAARREAYAHGLDHGVMGDWCARVSEPMDLEGVVRRLYFYPPPRAGATTLPDPQIEECWLGSVRIEQGEVDSEVGTRMAEETIAAVGARFGPGTRHRYAGGHISYHPGVWHDHEPLQDGARWRVGEATLAVGYNDVPLRFDPRVVALAFVPASAISLEQGPVTGEVAETDWSRRIDGRILAAARTAGLDEAATLASAYEASAGADGPTAPDSSLLEATEALLLAAEQSERPERRAAALLAADLGVRLLLDDVERPSCSVPFPRTVQRLVDRGVDILRFPQGCNPVYRNDLPARAYDADSTGAVGELGFVTLLARGWNREGPGAGSLMPRVIAEGAAFLAERPESELRGLVHFLIGDAYRDIVALASDLPTMYRLSPASAAEAGRAHLAALDHYRQGLELDPDPVLADRAWREAWRLRAGLPPTRARFHFIWD